MELSLKQQEDALLIDIIGRVDTTTAPVLNKIIQENWTCPNLVVDCNRLEYISSAGLRVLLAALKTAKAQGGFVRLLHVNESVMEVFEITGFKKLFQL